MFEWLSTIAGVISSARTVASLFDDDGGSPAAFEQPPPPPSPMFFSGIGASQLNGSFYQSSPEFEADYDFGTFTPPSIDWGSVGTAIQQVSGAFRQIGSLFDGENGGGGGVGGPDVVLDQPQIPEMQQAVFPVVGTLSAVAAAAIMKIRTALTGRTGLMSAGAISAYGRRVWSQVTGWVQRNPGTSAMAILAGLGLTAMEAAQFLAWGVTSKKRTRARGISGADLKRTRRTMRKLITMTNTLRELCGRGGGRGFGGYRRHKHAIVSRRA